MGACGTFRVNRQGVPDRIKRAKLKAGDPPVVEREDDILHITWFDKRQVHVMSTVHSTETFEKEVRAKHYPDCRRTVEKPCAIEAYSQHMGGIDGADKQLSHYMVLHRSAKWWKKGPLLPFRNLLLQCSCRLEAAEEEKVGCYEVPHADHPRPLARLQVFSHLPSRTTATEPSEQASP